MQVNAITSLTGYNTMPMIQDKDHQHTYIQNIDLQCTDFTLKTGLLPLNVHDSTASLLKIRYRNIEEIPNSNNISKYSCDHKSQI